MMLLIALSMFSIGTYLVWPSRWNIPAHINLGFALTAYVIPVMMTHLLDQFPAQLLDFYKSLIEIGAGFYLVGMICGAALPRVKMWRLPFSFASLGESELVAFVSRRAIWLGWFAIFGMIVSFRVMGFVPMFAENPLVAKYLRGTYQDTYRQVAVLFRGSEQIIVVTFPIIVILYYVTRHKVFALTAVLVFLLQSLTLARGNVGQPILLALGLIAASRGYKTLVAYAVAVAFTVLVASASTYYAARLLNPRAGQGDSSAFWENAASGTPDISDTLTFLWGFEEHPVWTYGRTFVGGLIPFHYRWNPGIWSLRVESGDEDLDVNDLISGGLRLPAPVMGYTAFGWPGVIVVCLLSGMATGYVSVFARTYIGTGSLIRSVLALSLYDTAVTQFIQFYNISIYTLFAVFIVLIFTYKVSLWPSLEAKGAAQPASA